MPNTFTIEGTLKNAKNVAIANKYIKFRIMSVGTDIEDNVTYPKETVEFQTDANGDFTGTLWVNGDSGVDCVYEIKLPNKGQRVQVVIPSAVAGSTVRLEDIIESYQVTASTQQSTVLDAALAYTNSLAADPSTNGNFSATEWRTDLGLVIGTNVQAYDAGLADLAGLTPTNESIIKGDGTNWVKANYFRVDAGTAGNGVEFGTSTANGSYAVAQGDDTTASGEASHSEGFFTTASGAKAHAEGDGTTASGFASHAEGGSSEASGDYSHAEGNNSAASGDYSHAEGFFTNASGNYSHAEGDSTLASGEYSHAEGGGSTASGIASHAEGQDTDASGDYSSATGRRSKAIHDGARVEADSQDADVSSTTTDQYTARFQNGYKFKGGLAAFEGGASFGDATTQSTTRANLGVAIYGQLYFSATAATTIAVAGTYVKLAGTTTSDSLNGITMPQNNRLQNNSGSTRVFQAMARADIIDGSGNKNIAIKLAKNGVLIDATESNGETTNNVAAHTTINWIVSLATGEYVEIWATNKSDTSSITAQHGHLFLKAID